MCLAFRAGHSPGTVCLSGARGLSSVFVRVWAPGRAVGRYSIHAWRPLPAALSSPCPSGEGGPPAERVLLSGQTGACFQTWVPSPVSGDEGDRQRGQTAGWTDTCTCFQSVSPEHGRLAGAGRVPMPTCAHVECGHVAVCVPTRTDRRTPAHAHTHVHIAARRLS